MAKMGEYISDSDCFMLNVFCDDVICNSGGVKCFYVCMICYACMCSENLFFSAGLCLLSLHDVTPDVKTLCI
jgi:hypothetical protein